MLESLDKAFEYFLKMPLFHKVLSIMTVLILPVPFKYLLAPAVYTNTEIASLFFEEWFFANNMLLVFHITAALPAVLIGPFMFGADLYKTNPKLHARLGKIYVTGCLLSAVTVIPLALHNGSGSFIAPIGFTTMATVWIIVTYLGYTAAIRKDFVAHRRWIMRSYAMTFAFVHVNLTFKYMYIYPLISLESTKALQSMVSWQMNLLFVELYLEATTFKGRFVGWKKFMQNTFSRSPADRFYLQPARGRT